MAREVEIGDPNKFLASLQCPLTHDRYACFSSRLAEILKKKIRKVLS